MDDVRVDDTWISDMRLVAEIHNIELSDEQLAAINVPHSSDALYYYAWLARYIEESSDAFPNRYCCVHIPNLDKKAVWKEYCDDMVHENQTFLSYKTFVSLWHLLFPHVKKKPMYGVMGHCEVCSFLTGRILLLYALNPLPYRYLLYL